MKLSETLGENQKPNNEGTGMSPRFMDLTDPCTHIYTMVGRCTQWKC